MDRSEHSNFRAAADPYSHGNANPYGYRNPDACPNRHGDGANADAYRDKYGYADSDGDPVAYAHAAAWRLLPEMAIPAVPALGDDE